MKRLLSRLRHDDQDAGFTLIELMVTMIMIGIIGALVVSAATNALQSNANDESLVTKSADAHTAIDRLTRSLRAAVDPVSDQTATPTQYSQGFLVTGPFSVTYYTNVKDLNLATNPNGTLAPTLVRDQVVEQPTGSGKYVLQETVWQPTATANGSKLPYTYTGYPTSGGATSTLAYGLGAPSGSTPALFTYYAPSYYSVGVAGDADTGAANCASTTTVTPTTVSSGGALWVGAQAGYAATTTAVASVGVNVTLVGGANTPQYAKTAKVVNVQSRVLIDAANNYTSRSGTCQ